MHLNPKPGKAGGEETNATVYEYISILGHFFGLIRYFLMGEHFNYEQSRRVINPDVNSRKQKKFQGDVTVVPGDQANYTTKKCKIKKKEMHKSDVYKSTTGS